MPYNIHQISLMRWRCYDESFHHHRLLRQMAVNFTCAAKSLQNAYSNKKKLIFDDPFITEYNIKQAQHSK